MNQEKRAELLARTKEDAIALVEDFDHLVEILEKVHTKAADLRRSSAILRRLLIEQKLQAIASPRIGKIQISTIDHAPVYRAARKGVYDFFISGGAAIHGSTVLQLAIFSVHENSQEEEKDQTLEFPLDTFLKQKVIFSNTNWFTRHQVIKFVANVGSGVHGGKIRTTAEKRLETIRHNICVTLENSQDGKKMPVVTIAMGESLSTHSVKEYDPTKINGVLFSLISTIHYLVNAKDVISLIETIKKNEM